MQSLNQNHSEVGRVALDSLDLQGGDDIVNDERPISQLHVGNILDAQDYLGSWHLSIVIDDGSNADAGGQTLNTDQRSLHFLPFQKANRDEIFSTED